MKNHTPEAWNNTAEPNNSDMFSSSWN